MSHLRGLTEAPWKHLLMVDSLILRLMQFQVFAGDLSGAQIDGTVALRSASRDSSSPIVRFITSEILRFYTEKVEKGRPDSLSVKIWAAVSHTLLKDKLLDFFALKTDFSKRLTSWRANSKFEDLSSGKSFKEFVRTLKNNYQVNQVFVWHALSGYWGGVSEHVNDELPKELSMKSASNSSSEVRTKFSIPTPHLLLVEPALAWDPGSLAGVGAVAIESLESMYRRMHEYLADAGVDGVKVDAQSGIGAFGHGFGGGANFARAVVRAVEDSVKQAFTKLPESSSSLYSRFFPSKAEVKDSPFSLEGCMCHSTENLLNFRETTMVRASDDFYPKDTAAQTVHIASCAYNSVMLGEIAVADWDMFHSKHEYALMHAAARAISGGPVYVSDGVGNHDPNILKRLVLPGGGILRTILPARPTVDCLFSDVMRDGKSALKVFSMNRGGGGVVGAFNVQGSSWDRKYRRYVQHEDHIPAVFTEVRASQLGKAFLSSSRSASGKFAVWSVLGQRLQMLRSKNDNLVATLSPRECEIYAFSHIFHLEQNRGMFSRSVEEKNVEWSPLGLIDMFNPGGALVQILTSRRSYEAKFVVRGVGRLGVYTNVAPISILVNGKRTEFTYESSSKMLVIHLAEQIENKLVSIVW